MKDPYIVWYTFVRKDCAGEGNSILKSTVTEWLGEGNCVILEENGNSIHNFENGNSTNMQTCYIIWNSFTEGTKIIWPQNSIKLLKITIVLFCIFIFRIWLNFQEQHYYSILELICLKFPTPTPSWSSFDPDPPKLLFRFFIIGSPQISWKMVNMT